MTARTLPMIVCLSALMSGTAFTQGRPASPQPVTLPTPGTPAPAPPAPRREGQPVNIKVEVTITDQRGGREALKKTVTVVTGDELAGFIRSSANYTGIGPVPLNVDIQPRLLADNKIRLILNLQYNLPAASVGAVDVAGAGTLRTTEIHENLALIVESGKPIVAAQSADPVGDRQVTVEVKATILR